MGTIVSFRIGQNDVESLGKYYQPIFIGDDLLRVPNHNTIVRTLIGGVPTQPFSMATLPALGTRESTLSRGTQAAFECQVRPAESRRREGYFCADDDQRGPEAGLRGDPGWWCFWRPERPGLAICFSAGSWAGSGIGGRLERSAPGR